MSLDWYAGQKCALARKFMLGDLVSLMMNNVEPPMPNVVYTVTGARACPRCGAHISLRELMDGEVFYPSTWFRPIDPKGMEELRALLNPPNVPVTIKELEKVE
jgi:hypothetical protein